LNAQQNTPELAYTLEIREQGKRLSKAPMPDPFHTTRIRPRGWRVALAVLFRRYEVEVLVGGDRERVEAVMELNPDYLGPAGSKSREAWNAQLERSLLDLAAREAEHDV
jgi:hypothetical protein